ncbi:hypothetical protein ADK76_22750 [Streptomyces griseoflavus]|uniref:hypothetical protein n=1 Tax=Streptomyces TaxID=1883 RepID=UPI0004C13317|nr:MULTISPECIES: hypothetical protein [Streptomyces]KOG54736.1 hypothetical protein ADK76_22750 [Streptomyces griseoflavus]KWT58669.1 hypothetical protein ADL21_28300 [Streptomyces albus subsp. albus]KOT93205.1 hypothetical protein ADK86_19360 [Streptomyces sp. NRRL F-5755]RSO10947.1 hypothetical protein DMH18_12555 [Streptomyces sp. WAC 06783]RSO43177.1 hypothetical protein DMH15_10825 [Streptomyces sp. WAC 06725]
MTDTDRTAFFSAVLKAIASTRNHGTDQDEHVKGVVEPAARIRAVEEEGKDGQLTSGETGEVLELLETTFRAKRTPDEEREYYLQYIEKVSGVSRASLGVSTW